MWFAEPERFRADRLAAMVADATGGELHVVLAPQPVWSPNEVRASAEDLDRYSAAPADEPDFAAIAELLCAPPEARYGWISDNGTGDRLGALVAGSAEFGLIAVRDQHDVWIRTFTPKRLSEVLTRLLPRGVPKSGAPPITVLRSEMLAASAEVVGAVRPSADVRRAERVIALPPSVVAEFSVETRSGDRRRRSEHPLRVYDTEHGRWVLRTSSHYGDERLELAPADMYDVVRLLEELRRELDV
ncbi:ESX secretion-associated protein EspG [Amycolatopsis nigrescens]|uniref:ESX secretion-associated protein EspG n=1 Tax=Amycolatopsis nigrescens TaxID=381445 RepID=UPI00037EA9BF|nr:ESX secretion-associated protein EspG [Amycolatopsis nigrescens]